MFEQSLVEAGVRTRRPWTVGVSVILQTALVSVGLLIPLINPELLPRTTAFIMTIAPPSPPSPPPPEPAMAAAPQQASQMPLQLDGRLLQPPSMPKQPMIIDEPVGLADSGPGVKGMQGLWNTARDSVSNVIASLTAVQSPTAPPPVVKEPEKVATQTIRLTIGGQVQEALLVNKVIPVYPALARTARIQGRVTFSAIIGRDGTIANLQVLSGHPLLRQAAFDAVRLWRYKPTMLNGEPVEVATTIDVNFIMNQ